MSKYKGLFTFDVDNHRYLPVEQADGIIGCMNYHTELEMPKEPLIKDEKIRKAVRAWWETIPDAVTDKRVLYKNNHDFAVGIYSIYCGEIYPETLEVSKMYTIAELCGEEEE